jgi:hypothetical protein
MKSTCYLCGDTNAQYTDYQMGLDVQKLRKLKFMTPIKDRLLVRLLRMNDEIHLKNGTKLWLDVDFEEMPHTPVVGEVESVPDGEATFCVGDIIVFDKNAGAIALRGDDCARIVNWDEKKVSIFLNKSDVIAVKRGEQMFTVNDYVITEPYEDSLKSEIIQTIAKKSSKVAKVVLAPEGAEVKNGDYVVFRIFADVPMEHDLHHVFFDKVTSRMPVDRIMGVVSDITKVQTI